MQKCDWCINDPECRGVARSECIVQDYRDFVRESIRSLTYFYYTVNTFIEGHAVQFSGKIAAVSEEDAIKRLIDTGAIHPRGYEFLELYAK